VKDSSGQARGTRRIAGRLGVLGAAVALVVGTLIAVTVPAALAATLYSNNFDSGDLSGWTKSGGTWGLATDGSQVYQQSKSDANDARTWYTPGSTFTDYTVQARVKPIAFGAATRFVALNARVQSATSEYRLALLDTNQAQLQTVDSGSTTFTVLIPRINLNQGEALAITTQGITTHHRFSIFPPAMHGQLDTYGVTTLTGTAQHVLF